MVRPRQFRALERGQGARSLTAAPLLTVIWGPEVRRGSHVSTASVCRSPGGGAGVRWT